MKGFRDIFLKFLSSSHGYFYFFGHIKTKIQVKVLFEILLNIIIKRIPGCFDRVVIYNAGERDDDRFCNATSDIHKELTFGLLDIKPNPDSCSQWLKQQIGF